MTIKPIIFEKTKFVDLTHDEWVEMFKPVKNHITKYPDEHSEYEMFETYGAEVEYVQSKIEENLVWTYGDGDMCSYISSGYGFVNRIGYYVCTVPFDPEVTYQIILSTEEECECYDEEDLENGGEGGNPDCKICEGYGLVTVYND